jgi:TPP-dependent pyruvate/acetoin dehydrogenase alpha subunit
MNHSWTPQSLIKFEDDVANSFNSGEIRAPIHLSDGSEESLIEIFAEVAEADWVVCSWRSHYQCLLKGVPEAELKKAILDGKSIALCFPEFNIFSSAIVGGQLSIAVGIALGLKRSGSANKVWCFLGDMTSETGVFQTSLRYAEKHNLPITFIVEDNGLSVMTDTRKVWNSNTLRFEELESKFVRSYKYKSKYPHAGAGVRVQF